SASRIAAFKSPKSFTFVNVLIFLYSFSVQKYNNFQSGANGMGKGAFRKFTQITRTVLLLFA
ncbi:MAG: hypothetical protein LBG45_10505, partial [Dysgonamonadaceae bacterium]|nr:hypothetical protein [Dysgonamonadaceae bacterium]